MPTQEEVSNYIRSLTNDQIFDNGLKPLIQKKFKVSEREAEAFFEGWLDE